jgi:opine dehydrogenase
MKSRYITEDVPVGCSSALSFANVLQVETPVIRAMTNLSNIMMETDYCETGYGLKNFGLEKMTAREMVAYMRTGK